MFCQNLHKILGRFSLVNAVILNTLIAASGFAASDFTELNLEQLMDMEVTTATKRPQKLSDTAAAIFVINQEDIRRSGARSIPEVLRMVPGVQVARIDANKWAISIRGFNNLFSDKILVLIDGRTVYNTIFSGVFWDEQDCLIEDIDRIEVIRGPGGSLWGANAVNGIINILTKNSNSTQGGVVPVALGTQEYRSAGFRYGGKFNEKATYRFYGKYFNYGDSVDAQGEAAWDAWKQYRLGFRSDIAPSADKNFTIQGDLYLGQTGDKVELPSFSPPFSTTLITETDLSGGNLLSRYSHAFSERSELTLQAYYDRAKRQLFVGDAVRDTIDFDFQHRVLISQRNDLIWGAGYRYIHHDIELDIPEIVDVEPANRSLDLITAFIQDEFAWVPDKLTLTIGSKFEHNDFTGFEFQPSIRLLWRAHAQHTFWGAVSRAVRTPSRANQDFRIVESVYPPAGANPFPTVVRFRGNKTIQSEDLLAFELGYRTLLRENLSFDIAAFLNDYDDLVTAEIGPPSVVPPETTIPVQPANLASALAYGFELLADWLPFEWWKLQAAYSFIHLKVDLDSNSTDINFKNTEGKSPEHQFSLRSMMDISHNLQLDLWLRSVDRLESIDISGYTTLDARIGWRPLDNLELSIVGQNLFDAQHPEFVDTQFKYVNTEVQRSAYAMLVWSF